MFLKIFNRRIMKIFYLEEKERYFGFCSSDVFSSRPKILILWNTDFNKSPTLARSRHTFFCHCSRGRKLVRFTVHFKITHVLSWLDVSLKLGTKKFGFSKMKHLSIIFGAFWFSWYYIPKSLDLKKILTLNYTNFTRNH